MKEKSNTITWIVSIIIIVIFFLFLRSILFPSDQQTTSNTNSNLEPIPIVNGVQEVTLGFGKFNYNPSTIVVKKGIPVKITADLTRLTGCFRSLEIPAFGISTLFSKSNDNIQFTPDKIGTYPFSCAMGMGKGVIKVI